MSTEKTKQGRWRIMAIFICVLGMLSATMGGCEWSCNSNDTSDDIKDVVDEIGDEAEDIVDKIKEKDQHASREPTRSLIG